MNLENRVKKLEAAGPRPRPLPPLLPGESAGTAWLWCDRRGTDPAGRATAEIHRLFRVLPEIDDVPAGMEHVGRRRFAFVLLLIAMNHAPEQIRQQAAALVVKVLDDCPGDGWPSKIECGPELRAWLFTDRRWAVVHQHTEAMDQEASKRWRTRQEAGR